jgi:hypothetical protein
MALTERINSEQDILNAMESYLESLLDSFLPSIAELNQQNRSFVIIEGLQIGDIYSEDDFKSPSYRHVDIFQLLEFANKLRAIITSGDEFHHFYERAAFECVVWECPETEYDDYGNIVGDIDNPSFKIFAKIGSLFMQKLDFVTNQLIQNNFEDYWVLIFELKTLDEIETFFLAQEAKLQARKIQEEKRTSQRAICSFYQLLFVKVSETFVDFYNSELLPEDADLTFENDSRRTICLIDSCALSTGLYSLETPREAFRKVILEKIRKYDHKFTIRDVEENFLAGLNRIAKVDTDVTQFAKECFHFDDSVFTNKVANYRQPAIRASNLGTFLKVYFEKNKIPGAIKADLIAWLAYEFYGRSGYSYHIFRTSIVKKHATSKQKESGNTITKSFLKKYPDLFKC